MADRYASLASATATAIDSAAKHNLQCRMNTQLLQSWASDDQKAGNGAQNLKNRKMDFCMHKDEVVLGCGANWFPGPSGSKPYPLVFTTYANMSKGIQAFLKALYAQETMSDVDDLIKFVQNPEDADYDEKKATIEEFFEKWGLDYDRDFKDQRCHIMLTPQFYFQGISLGLAYAHPDSGDTVGTVMYGGLRTITNGHFCAQNGQPVMWYFEFEYELFDPKTGERINPGKVNPRLHEKDWISQEAKTRGDVTVLGRKRIRGMELGQPVQGHYGKRGMILVKPYIFDERYPLDRQRVFGKYLSSGRPFEKIDVQISRLAL